MKTPQEECSEIDARIQYLKSKIVALKRHAVESGIAPDQFQIDQILGEIPILEKRLDFLKTFFR